MRHRQHPNEIVAGAGIGEELPFGCYRDIR